MDQLNLKWNMALNVENTEYAGQMEDGHKVSLIEVKRIYRT